MSNKVLENEKELLSLMRQDDMQAFERIFRHYHKPLWYFAKEYLKDADEAEDTIQQLFLTLWERRKELLIGTSLKSYLYTAVRNSCLKKLDKTTRTQLLEQSEEEDAGYENYNASGMDPILEKDLQQAIEKAIARLPERCRLVFRLSRFANMSYQEIANELDLSVKTVENQISKALAMLRVSLQSHLIWIITLMIKLF